MTWLREYLEKYAINYILQRLKYFKKQRLSHLSVIFLYLNNTNLKVAFKHGEYKQTKSHNTCKFLYALQFLFIYFWG